jgi:hypothetical protein
MEGMSQFQLKEGIKSASRKMQRECSLVAGSNVRKNHLVTVSRHALQDIRCFGRLF